MTSTQQIPPWLEALYPFKPRQFVTSGGARMSFLDEGPRNDEAVLMLHGNPTWSFFYRDLVRALQPEMRCIVPDHIGMGLSDKPAGYAYTLETRVADVEALVASLGLKRVHLVVHDWGGAIGFGFATRHPGVIGRITILNTAAFFLERLPARIALCRFPWIGGFLVRGLNAFAWPATWMAMHSRRLTVEERKGYLFPYDSWDNRIAVHQFVKDIPMTRDHPSRATLETISSRLSRLADHRKLIVWGQHDFCFNDAFLHRWSGIYPDAEIRRFSEAGHYVLEDAGAPARERIVRFLTDKGPS